MRFRVRERKLGLAVIVVAVAFYLVAAVIFNSSSGFFALPLSIIGAFILMHSWVGVGGETNSVIELNEFDFGGVLTLVIGSIVYYLAELNLESGILDDVGIPLIAMGALLLVLAVKKRRKGN